MTLALLVIAIVLLVVAAAPDLVRLRDFSWFENYLRWLDARLRPNGFWDSWLGILLVVLPPTLLLGWLMILAQQWLFGIAGFVLSLIGLFLLLGPRDLSEDLIELAHAFDANARLRAQKLFGVEESTPQSANQLLQPVLNAALKRHFAPIFYFAITGLGGALAYRLLQLIADDKSVQQALPERFVAAAVQGHAILAWLPAQAMCLALALASDFDAVARAWSEYHEQNPQARRYSWLDLSLGFLASTMRACIDLDDVDEATIGSSGSNELANISLDAVPLQHAQQLLSRITMTWLVAIAIVVLARFLV